jgi:hypothetical protein
LLWISSKVLFGEIISIARSGAPSKNPFGKRFSPYNRSLAIKARSGDRLLPVFILKAVLESQVIPSR